MPKEQREQLVIAVRNRAPPNPWKTFRSAVRSSRGTTGIPVQDEAVLELARLVDDGPLADRLETAYGRLTKVLALTIPERETIIRALDDAPDGLEELRAVLIREHVGRKRSGLT